MISRNFWQKNARVKFRHFYTMWPTTFENDRRTHYHEFGQMKPKFLFYWTSFFKKNSIIIFEASKMHILAIKSPLIQNPFQHQSKLQLSAVTEEKTPLRSCVSLMHASDLVWNAQSCLVQGVPFENGIFQNGHFIYYRPEQPNWDFWLWIFHSVEI